MSLNISNVYLSLSCSYVIPQDNGRIVDQSKGTQQTVWDSNCGHSFGHELTFSRTLEMQMNQTTNFETVKNSHGGSEIYRDWYPNHGRYWNELQSSIRSRKGSGNWKGFLWHQGTQGMTFVACCFLCSFSARSNPTSIASYTNRGLDRGRYLANLSG